MADAATEPKNEDAQAALRLQLRKLLADDADLKIIALVEPQMADRARTVAEEFGGRLEVVEGDSDGLEVGATVVVGVIVVTVGWPLPPVTVTVSGDGGRGAGVRRPRVRVAPRCARRAAAGASAGLEGPAMPCFSEPLPGMCRHADTVPTRAGGRLSGVK